MSNKNNQQNQQKRGELPASKIYVDEAPFIPPAAAYQQTLGNASHYQPVLAADTQKSLDEIIPGHLKEVMEATNQVKEEVSQESLQPEAPVTQESPISGVTAADLTVEEEPAKVDPRQARINNFLLPFKKYAERMDAGVPQDKASIIRNQRELFRGFRNLLAVEDAQIFGPAFKEVLVLWHDNQDGAFNAGVRLYRQIDNLQLSPQENLEFNTLLRLMDAIHDPAMRKANLLEIDLNRALPEIGGIDARGYLAGFVRRF